MKLIYIHSEVWLPEAINMLLNGGLLMFCGVVLQWTNTNPSKHRVTLNREPDFNFLIFIPNKKYSFFKSLESILQPSIYLLLHH